MDESDYVFTPEMLDRYTIDRFFCAEKNITPHNASTIVQHNGARMENLENVSGNRFRAPCTKEHYLFDPVSATIHIPNPIGEIRMERTRRTVQSWISRCVSRLDKYSINGTIQIRYTEVPLNKNEYAADIQFDNNAYDLVKRLFTNKDKDLEGSGIELDSLAEIGTIIMGDLDSVTAVFSEEPDYLEKRVLDDYLSYQFMHVDGKKILCFDYIFGDQADAVIRKITRAYNSLSRHISQRLKLRIFPFGKYGGLAPGIERGDIVVPISALPEGHFSRNKTVKEEDYYNEAELHHRELGERAFNAGRNLHIGPTLHSSGVVEQRKSILYQAQLLGAVCIDMESWYITHAVAMANSNYAHQENCGVETECYMIGFVSDAPLRGDTLAEPFDDSMAKNFVINEIKRAIFS